MDAKSSRIQPTFLFDDRRRFDAECEHDRLRSSFETTEETLSTADPWKQRPIDFTMKNFHPNRKRSEKISSLGNTSPKEKPTQTSRSDDAAVMRPFAKPYLHSTKSQTNNDENDFLLRPRIKYDKVKRMLNTEQYRNPTLHDFRQYPNIHELGLSEFHTAHDRDPYKIRFLSDHLNTIWLQEREDERVPAVVKPMPEMQRALTARLKWDTKLVLPKLVFPNKYAAYTRYRNPTRTVQSAYWERVEDRFPPGQKKRLDVHG